MDSLVPAFVAALLAGVGDRPAWLAAMLGDRYRNTPLVLAGLAAAHAFAAGIAAVGGILVAPILTPNAKALLLAIALIFAGIAAMLRTRAPNLDRGTLGAFGAAAIGGGVLALGDRTAFITFALAARGPSPTLAAAGAVAGAMILAAIALAKGGRGWTRSPRRAISGSAGVLLLGTGLVTGVGALRLI